MSNFQSATQINLTLQSLSETHFNFPGQTHFYKGKVRDVYTVGDLLIMIVTDRISAFDVVLPKAIPYKGQVLNQIASYMLEATKDIVPNWLLSVPDPNVSIGRKTTPYKVEMVIRGYLTGHAWREYSSGKRMICGVSIPNGLKENEPFNEPIITPTTKASKGHDEDISREEIIRREIVSDEEYIQLENYTRRLYVRGSEIAKKRGLILVDTKYEFGKFNNDIYLIDEIHTPDSSRYFYAEGYEDNLRNNKPQRQLSKEFVRQWLIDNNFQGKKGQKIPEMKDEWILQISNRYIELFEKITGEQFHRFESLNINDRIEKNILNALKSLVY